MTTKHNSHDRAARPDAAVGALPAEQAGAPDAPPGAPVAAPVPAGRWWRAGGRQDDPFIPLLVMLRWGCLIVAILGLRVAQVREVDPGALVAVVLGVLHATARTLAPVRGIGTTRTPAGLRGSAWVGDLA